MLKAEGKVCKVLKHSAHMEKSSLKKEADNAAGVSGRPLEEEQPEHGFTEIDKVEEMKSLQRVLDAYMDYRGSMEDDIIRWERSFHRLPQNHRNLVTELPAKYAALRRCADQNAFLIDTMLQAFDAPFQLDKRDDCQTDGSEGVLPAIRDASENGKHLGTGDENGGASEGGRETELPGEGNPLSGQKRSRDESSAPERTILEADNGSKARTNGFHSTDVNMPSGSRRSGDVDIHPWEGVNAFPAERALDTQGEARPVTEVEPVHTQGVAGHEEAGPIHIQAGLGAYPEAEPVHTHVNGGVHEWGSGGHSHRRVPASDVEKVRCVLRNIVRDWSSEGASERAECYGPILAELESCFSGQKAAEPPSCVIPGAGLARLACEISRLGFVVQGNEFSYYTLIVSSFILNMTDAADEWVFYPWIHSQCNTRRDDDMLRPVRIPDLHPGSAGITEGFSMCAGDFLEVYGGPNQAGAWDSLVTCFFIDTAHNIIAYLEVIARILKPGGVWINFGPLLYHFADAHQYSQDDDLSVELSLETILRIAQSFGLTLKREPRFVSTSYTGNPRSMMTTKYNCAFWTMIKG